MSDHLGLTAEPADVKSLTAALAAPFDAKEIKWKPQSVKGNRALALAYVDARLVQDRLDEVLGVEGWQDEYELLADGSVVCKLQCKLGDRWITKMDVGGPSEQPDGGDRQKAAFSDALKRAAVKFGIGRYLYRLAAQWADYDPVKKQFAQPPQLPGFALPKSARKERPPAPNSPPAAPKPKPAAARPDPLPTDGVKNAAHALPADGSELHRRLRDYDAKLAATRACGLGSLLSHVTQAGVKAGYGDDMTRWGGPAIPFAVEAVKEFEAQLRTSKADPKPAAA